MCTVLTVSARRRSSQMRQLSALALSFSLTIACGGAPARVGPTGGCGVVRVGSDAPEWDGLAAAFHGGCFCARSGVVHCLDVSATTWVARPVPTPEPCAEVHDSCIRSRSGSVLCAQAGDENFSGPLHPVFLPGPVRDLAASCAALDDGTVWCWGSGDVHREYGFVGVSRIEAGPVTCAIVAHRVVCLRAFGGDPLDEFGVAPVGTARVELTELLPGFANCAFDSSGTPLCWGANEEGQLARGYRSATEAAAPAALAAGWTSLMSTGTLVCGLAGDDVMCANDRLAVIGTLPGATALGYVPWPASVCAISRDGMRCFERTAAWTAHEVSFPSDDAS